MWNKGQEPSVCQVGAVVIPALECVCNKIPTWVTITTYRLCWSEYGEVVPQLSIDRSIWIVWGNSDYVPPWYKQTLVRRARTCPWQWNWSLLKHFVKLTFASVLGTRRPVAPHRAWEAALPLFTSVVRARIVLFTFKIEVWTATVNANRLLVVTPFWWFLGWFRKTGWKTNIRYLHKSNTVSHSPVHRNSWN